MLKIIIAVATLLLFDSYAFAGNAVGNGNRMILVTYWGDDKVALIDLNGEQGHEEVWALDTLKGGWMRKTL